MYFYKEKGENLTSDYIYLKQADVTEDTLKQSVTVKCPGEQRTIRVADTKAWSQAIRARSMEIIREQGNPIDNAPITKTKDNAHEEIQNFYKGGINPAHKVKF